MTIHESCLQQLFSHFAPSGRNRLPGERRRVPGFLAALPPCAGRVAGMLLVLCLWLMPVSASAAGTAVAWGLNDFGQTTVPTNLSGVTVAMATGIYHSVALKSDGTVVAWGRSAEGQTTIPTGLSGVTAIGAGEYHTVALKSDGTVVVWGSNGAGQTNVPAGLSGVTAISAGDAHTLAVKSDGTVAAWGHNVEGQTAVPAGLTGVTAVSAGTFNSVALKGDGTVVAWGRSAEGQASIPAGLTGVTAIAAGTYHTVALKSDGTVVAWGRSAEGQTTPPDGLTGVTAVAAGTYHTVALKSDGTVVAWGRNTEGQTSVPAGLRGVLAIAAGPFHSVALVGGARVVNLSVRSAAGTGAQTLIAGMVITGTGSKALLLRGMGPALIPYGVVTAMTDPVLRLYNGAGAEIDSNNDWGGTTIMTDRFNSLVGWVPAASSKDAALYRSIASGAYTFHIVANTGSPGVALAELYDAESAEGAAKVVNISARTQVGTGENILIAGFVITGDVPRSMLLRGLGPTLTGYGVTGAIADPQLALYRDGVLVGSNDNWGGSQILKDAYTLVGAAALVSDTSKDAALLVTLQAGVYSAQVSGVASTTGVGLVEIFLMP